MQPRAAGRFLDGPFANDNAFVPRTVQLPPAATFARRLSPANAMGPKPAEHPEALLYDLQNHAKPTQASPQRQITNAQLRRPRVSLKCLYNLRQIFIPANRRPRNDTRAPRSYKPDNRISTVAEPVFDSGIYYLKTSRVPAVFEHKLAGSFVFSSSISTDFVTN